ncbi:MAG TPA: hypothetical protein VEX36_06310 [Thermoleophilaceae bacterium]|nr:hypothetical protein [Thermoleophilaceae bacterium]
MASTDRQALEQRIFELLADHTAFEISQELGVPYEETMDMVEKVIRERGTPHLAAVRRAIDRLEVLATQI